jgi:hypothetical protein
MYAVDFGIKIATVSGEPINISIAGTRVNTAE